MRELTKAYQIVDSFETTWRRFPNHPREVMVAGAHVTWMMKHTPCATAKRNLMDEIGCAVPDLIAQRQQPAAQHFIDSLFDMVSDPDMQLGRPIEHGGLSYKVAQSGNIALATLSEICRHIKTDDIDQTLAIRERIQNCLAPAG